MSLRSYGVLKAHPIKKMMALNQAHLQIQLLANQEDYRIALNVKSAATPNELRYIIYRDFKHPLIEELVSLKDGITSKEENEKIAIDYIRSNIFSYKKMKLAQNISDGDNELSDTVEMYIERAMKSENAYCYAFGEYWEPDDGEDKYFGFTPNRGIHDIHMNQGNASPWDSDNGVFQDGGLLIHFPDEQQWVAIFLAFQSQSFHTDDVKGNILEAPYDDEDAVKLISALMNPCSGSANIRIMNRTDKPIDINNWSIKGYEISVPLTGIINSGEILLVEVEADETFFSRNGGVVTILDENGNKIHGASYTTPDYILKGYSKIF